MSTDYTTLPYHFISVKGADAEKFLQGQMSCDISSLDTSKASYGTVNTPKGRMYGLFLIVKTDEGFLLRLHESTSDAVLTQLAKYKVFFKCDLALEPDLHAYGSLKEDGATRSSDLAVCSNDQGWSIRLPGATPLFEHWTTEALESNEDSLQEWHCLESQNGLPELYQSTSDKFILQYLNLQHLDAVSFNKGCYTGQEIIARMKFLGKLKKKMFLLRSDDQTTRSPGSNLLDETGKKCGELVRSHWHPKHGSVALGILDLSYAENDKPVFLDDDLKVPFTVEELVYN